MTKAGEGESVRAAIDLKDKVRRTLYKYKKLNIVFRDPEKLSVPSAVEPVQVSTAKTVTVTDSEWKFRTDVPESVTIADLELDPTTPQAQLAILRKKLVR